MKADFACTPIAPSHRRSRWFGSKSPLVLFGKSVLAMAMTVTCGLAGAEGQEVAQATRVEVDPSTKAAFRVETVIFEGTEPKPQSQHLMLFDSGLVYDMPVGVDATITVFDPLRGRVVLLHKIQKVKTSISNESLIRIAAQLRATAVESKAGTGLGLDAKVAAGESPESYTIEFGDTKYFATTQPALNDSLAEQYAEFTIWACRLNLARQIGSPPFARITLAEFLAAEKLLPRQIRLEVRRGLKTRIFRAEHSYVGRLSDADRKRIGEVGAMMAGFEEVAFAEFPVD